MAEKVEMSEYKSVSTTRLSTFILPIKVKPKYHNEDNPSEGMISHNLQSHVD